MPSYTRRTRLQPGSVGASLALLLCGSWLFAQPAQAASEEAAVADAPEHHTRIKQAQEMTRPYHAEYHLKRRGRTHGTAERQLWRLDTGDWRYRTATEARILFLSDRRYNETTFMLEEDQVRPLNYEYTREGTGSNSYFYVTFDRDAGRFVTDGGDPVAAAWDPQLLDPNAVLHQLQLDLAGPGDRWTYELIDEDGEHTSYEFARAETETLHLPVGEIEAVRVDRVRDSDHRHTHFWFAKDYNYTLVQMQQIEDSREQARLELKRLTFND